MSNSKLKVHRYAPRAGTAVAAATALFLSVLVGGVLSPAASAATTTTSEDFTAYAMAPLAQLTSSSDWSTFDSQLTAAKNEGIDGIAIDVWWGTVEGQADNSFNWSYYDTMFSHVASHNLKIVPVFSFHSCGGNVGDDCNIPIPSWIWNKFSGQTLNGVSMTSDALKYKSEQGNVNSEYVQGWADSLIDQDYADFTKAFVSHFSSAYNNVIDEIDVSLGPAGELRYPSYNSHDQGTGWPGRGALQAYSALAVKDFQSTMLAKYSSLSGVNAAWGTSLTSTSQITPPSDRDNFFTSGAYMNTRYGKDFIDWYNDALVDHGQRVLQTVSASLGSAFPDAELAYKVPGVNWAMTNPAYPRAAEVAAGLIQTSLDVNSDATGHGYQNIIGLANRVSTSARPVDMYFTAVEATDNNTASAGYTQGESLVFWIAQNAQAQGVTIKAENALEGGVTSDYGWSYINNAFDWAPYAGLDVLRLADVTSGVGATQYSAFIQKHRPGYASMYIRGTNNDWGVTAMTKVNGIWQAKGVSFGSASGQSFKFDVTGDWTTNFGGSSLSGTAVPNGPNIPVASNTRYDISFNPSNNTYTVTPS